MIIKALYKTLVNPEGAEGLSPTITIKDIAGTAVITDAALIAIADGFYYYNFAAYDASKEYTWVITAPSLGATEKYLHGATQQESVLTKALDTAIEGFTLVETLKLVLSVLTGISTGGGTNSVAFRDITNAKDRVRAVVNMYGNRSAVTLDAS